MKPLLLLTTVLASATTLLAGPVPTLRGFTWGEMWVNSCAPCTRNGVAEYDAIIVIGNEGDADYRIDSMRIAGTIDNAIRFGSSDIEPGRIMGPGTAESMAVHLSLCADEPYDGEIWLHYTDLATGMRDSVSAALQAVGTESCVQISDLTIEGAFGTPMPITARGTIRVASTGTRPVTITSARLIGEGVDLEEMTIGTTPLPTLILPGDTIEIEVLFTPRRGDSEPRDALLTLTGDFAYPDCPGSCSDSAATIRGLLGVSDVEDRSPTRGRLDLSALPR